jgi:hypothetical protein
MTVAQFFDRAISWERAAEVFYSALAEIRSEKITTLDDAYELANRLESSEINSVFQMLVLDKLDPDTRRELLRSQFEEHVARLAELRRTFTREERRALSCS